MVHRNTLRVAVAVAVIGALPPAARAAVDGAAGGKKGGPSLISLGLDGHQADGASFAPAISADGRYVAFASAASTLVPGDTNAFEDVFVFDRVAQKTERVSLTSKGEQGRGDSYGPSLSADGRYVAFTSSAPEFSAGDTNGELDVFVHDRVSGSTVLASVGPHGAPADGPSVASSLSGDGLLVAFESDATTLVGSDTNGTGDVFVHDIATGVTRRLSVGLEGAEAEGPSFGPAISTDGRWVAFESFSSRLVAGDTNGALDVFVADVTSGTVSRVSLATGGGQANSRSYSPSISADGRVVAFASFADNLSDGDSNGLLDVFVHRRDEGTTTRLSVGPDGAQSDGLSFAPVVSAGGSLVVFSSEAANLVPEDSNGNRDVFLADASTGAVSRLSRPRGKGPQGDGPSLGAVADASGAMVAFTSFATNLVAGDTNGASDVFLVPGPAAAPPGGGGHKKGGKR